MDRRNFAFVSLSAFIAPAATAATVSGRPNGTTPPESSSPGRVQVPARPLPLRISDPTKLDIQSAPVHWQGGPVHLVTLASFRCELDATTKQLTASIEGSLLTFDEVDYDVSAVVFDRWGEVLGAARAVCKVPRIWLGVYASQPVALNLDFGRSNRFADATHVMVAISDRDVLTPDQWQKSEEPAGGRTR